MKYELHDTLLQAACPTLMVPKFGSFEPLDKPGQRYLSACDGLWIEIRRPWLHLLWPIAVQDDFTMPYGALEKKVELAFNKIPPPLIEQFLTDATAAFPNEFGAWLVWNDEEKERVYRPLEATEATGAFLQFERPTLADHESLAVDLHSHGRHRALFSTTDNRDDRGEVKIAGVYGSLDREITTAFRLCTGGKFISIPSAA